MAGNKIGVQKRAKQGIVYDYPQAPYTRNTISITWEQLRESLNYDSLSRNKGPAKNTTKMLYTLYIA